MTDIKIETELKKVRKTETMGARDRESGSERQRRTIVVEERDR